MMEKKILIIGAGGHSKVATEIIEQNAWHVAGYIDENEYKTFLNKPVYKTIEEAERSDPNIKYAFIAIGASEHRRKWFVRMKSRDYTIPFFIHKTAWVSPSASIQEGALVCANSTIGPQAKIGICSIINSNAVLDHDSSIGEFSHLSQGAIGAGGCMIGTNVVLGVGCTVDKMCIVNNNTTYPPGTHIASTR